MADIIQLRRDTAANWTSVDPTLADGEMGIETDTLKQKIGDGSTAWTGLSYLASGGGGGSSWTIQTIANADFTAADNITYDCQAGAISADRVITVSSITKRFRVINGQDTYTLRFSGATVYNMGGTEAVTYVMALAAVTVELIMGKLIITGGN